MGNSRWSFSKKWNNGNISSLYSVMMVCYYPSVKKSKIIFSPPPQKKKKNALKDDISVEKDDIHPRKYGISSHRKIEDVKKFNFIKKFQWYFGLLWRML